jgi:hypothetical protein
MDGSPAVQPPQRQRGMSPDGPTAEGSLDKLGWEPNGIDESPDLYEDGPPAVQPLHRQHGMSRIKSTAGKSPKKLAGEPDRKRKRVVT